MSETFDKIKVLCAQLDSAIILVSLEDGFVAAHTVIMASEEISRTWYVKKKLSVEFDYRIYVKDEHQRAYLQKMREKYNFFKHANRDINEILEIDREQIHYINEVLLGVLVSGYRNVFTQSSLAMDTYIQWVEVVHPHLIKWENIPGGAHIKALAAKTSTNKPLMLRVMLYEAGVLPMDDFDLLQVMRAAKN